MNGCLCGLACYAGFRGCNIFIPQHLLSWTYMWCPNGVHVRHFTSIKRTSSVAHCLCVIDYLVQVHNSSVRTVCDSYIAGLHDSCATFIVFLFVIPCPFFFRQTGVHTMGSGELVACGPSRWSSKLIRCVLLHNTIDLINPRMPPYTVSRCCEPFLEQTTGHATCSSDLLAYPLASYSIPEW